MSNPRYSIHKILPVIQGEGCKTGIPMVLLRLHGCTVGCPWCDTKAAMAGLAPLEMFGRDIATAIKRGYPHFSWVMVTGGEPAEQELFALADWLKREGYKLALETNGAATGCLGIEWDWVCVSPKPDKPPLRQVLRLADEIKMVIETMADVDFLDGVLESVPIQQACQVCVQPMSQDQDATDLCVRIAMERQWRLSIQVHKYIGQP